MAELQIVYASETGNAEDVAYSLHEQLGASGVECSTSNIASVTLSALSQMRAVVLVVATAGDGEAPTAMRPFWKSLLRKNLTQQALAGLQFAVFGLGDSSYEFYNAAARKLFTRLRQLGGQPIVPLGLGDDQARLGYLGGLVAWTASLLAQISKLDVVSKRSSVRGCSPGDMFCIEQGEGIESMSSLVQLQSAHVATVARNERMTSADWWQDVRHLSFALDPLDPMTNYEPGDILAVYYENNRQDVDALLSMLSLPADQPIRIQALHDRQNRLASAVTTPRILFTSLLDICARPKRSFFRMLSNLAQNPEEKAKLIELASPEGTDLYFDYCVRERRSHVEVMREFRSLVVDLPSLLSALPVLRPREYSIASAREVHPGQCDLCVAIVTHRTPYGRVVPGLCTHFLRNLHLGECMRYRILSGPLRDTQLLQTSPLLLIGPGTGVSSMRAVLQRQVAAQVGEEASRAVWPASPSPLPLLPPSPPPSSTSPLLSKDLRAVLFFGCRRSTKDFLFAQEWSALPRPWFHVDVAFSQDLLLSTEGPTAKVYVQHRIAEHGREVSAMLLRGAGVYIAGAAKNMPKAVRKALVAALVEHGELSPEEAEQWLARLKSQGKYLVEAWS